MGQSGSSVVAVAPVVKAQALDGHVCLGELVSEPLRDMEDRAGSLAGVHLEGAQIGPREHAGDELVDGRRLLRDDGRVGVDDGHVDSSLRR